MATTRKRGQAREAFPAYSADAGPLAFLCDLTPRERGTVRRALEIVGRRLREPGSYLANSDEVKAYLRLHLACEEREVFAALYLDAQHRVIAFDRISVGTLTQTSVYPREVVRAALGLGAASVVLAHNHPSGNVTPSAADQGLTRTLKSALALVDVRVLDHVIVGGHAALSMAERGLI